MNDLKNKSTNKGTSELVFWINGLFDLHKIVEYPNTIDRLICDREDQVFNFFESMHPLNI